MQSEMEPRALVHSGCEREQLLQLKNGIAFYRAIAAQFSNSYISHTSKHTHENEQWKNVYIQSCPGEYTHFFDLV
jgi:hypothetical protein